MLAGSPSSAAASMLPTPSRLPTSPRLPVPPSPPRGSAPDIASSANPTRVATPRAVVPAPAEEGSRDSGAACPPAGEATLPRERPSTPRSRSLSSGSLSTSSTPVSPRSGSRSDDAASVAGSQRSGGRHSPAHLSLPMYSNHRHHTTRRSDAAGSPPLSFPSHGRGASSPFAASSASATAGAVAVVSRSASSPPSASGSASTCVDSELLSAIRPAGLPTAPLPEDLLYVFGKMPAVADPGVISPAAGGGSTSGYLDTGPHSLVRLLGPRLPASPSIVPQYQLQNAFSPSGRTDGMQACTEGGGNLPCPPSSPRSNSSRRRRHRHHGHHSPHGGHSHHVRHPHSPGRPSADTSVTSSPRPVSTSPGHLRRLAPLQTVAFPPLILATSTPAPLPPTTSPEPCIGVAASAAPPTEGAAVASAQVAATTTSTTATAVAATTLSSAGTPPSLVLPGPLELSPRGLPLATSPTVSLSLSASSVVSSEAPPPPPLARPPPPLPDSAPPALLAPPSPAAAGTAAAATTTGTTTPARDSPSQPHRHHEHHHGDRHSTRRHRTDSGVEQRRSPKQRIRHRHSSQNSRSPLAHADSALAGKENGAPEAFSSPIRSRVPPTTAAEARSPPGSSGRSPAQHEPPSVPRDHAAPTLSSASVAHLPTPTPPPPDPLHQAADSHAHPQPYNRQSPPHAATSSASGFATLGLLLTDYPPAYLPHGILPGRGHPDTTAAPSSNLLSPPRGSPHAGRFLPGAAQQRAASLPLAVSPTQPPPAAFTPSPHSLPRFRVPPLRMPLHAATAPAPASAPPARSTPRTALTSTAAAPGPTITSRHLLPTSTARSFATSTPAILGATPASAAAPSQGGLATLGTATTASPAPLSARSLTVISLADSQLSAGGAVAAATAPSTGGRPSEPPVPSAAAVVPAALSPGWSPRPSQATSPDLPGLLASRSRASATMNARSSPRPPPLVTERFDGDDTGVAEWAEYMARAAAAGPVWAKNGDPPRTLTCTGKLPAATPPNDSSPPTAAAERRLLQQAAPTRTTAGRVLPLPIGATAPSSSMGSRRATPIAPRALSANAVCADWRELPHTIAGGSCGGDGDGEPLATARIVNRGTASTAPAEGAGLRVDSLAVVDPAEQGGGVEGGRSTSAADEAISELIQCLALAPAATVGEAALSETRTLSNSSEPRSPAPPTATASGEDTAIGGGSAGSVDSPVFFAAFAKSGVHTGLGRSPPSHSSTPRSALPPANNLVSQHRRSLSHFIFWGLPCSKHFQRAKIT